MLLSSKGEERKCKRDKETFKQSKRTKQHVKHEKEPIYNSKRVVKQLT